MCGLYVFFLTKNLPSVQSLKNYHPPLLSVVLDRNGQKAGEFFKERRFLVPYQDIPEVLVQAFVSAEDGRFFEHKGLNVKAIFRAFLVNLRAGKKVQGGSTITQQVARSHLLSSEKTYKRKLKEAILALRIEKHFTKEEILYLYLNQIYLGHGAYGVGMAGEIYFRKKIKDLTLPESALLAGLPQAPSRFSPIYNPQKAKERQLYTLNRMLEENYIDKESRQKASQQALKVFLREKYHEKAPYYMETLRQSLLNPTTRPENANQPHLNQTGTNSINEEQLLTGGLIIKSALDLSLQKIARESLQKGLRDLDKRQGFRGSLQNIQKEENIKLFFEKEEKAIIAKKREFRWIWPLTPANTSTQENHSPPTVKLDQKDQSAKSAKDSPASDNKASSLNPPSTEEQDLRTIKTNEIVHALVREVDDQNKKVLVQLAFKNYGVLKNMKWARKPDPKVSFKSSFLEKPSQALKKGDVILTKVESPLPKEECDKMKNWKYIQTHNINTAPPKKLKNSKTPHTNSEPDKTCGFLLSLEQEPLAEGALIALDQKTGDILALVGGYDFERSQFNRAYQAERQTGSVFKPLVYLSALDKGWTPATVITDTPLVYEKEEADMRLSNNKKPATDSSQKLPAEPEEPEEEHSRWKPDNYGKRFSGDILFRNALIRSMNVPTVKLIEDVGVPWVTRYARRLGLFSPLNPDYTLALGSSSVTLYEMTKMFAIIGRLGKNIHPLLVHEVLNTKQEKILSEISLDERFFNKKEPYEKEIAEQREKFLQKLLKEKDKNKSPHNINPPAPDSPKETKEHTDSKIKQLKDPTFFFSDPEQIIADKTAFIMTTLLQAVIQDPHGTGGRAKEIDWPLAGKTGTTNGYYDGWFIGFSPQMAVGVWVGFDDEKSLGIGETGARSALPIWIDFMKQAHADKEKEDFKTPEGIVFTHIDNKTGQLVSPQSVDVALQAFVEGTQPQEEVDKQIEETDHDFLREDFSQ